LSKSRRHRSFHFDFFSFLNQRRSRQKFSIDIVLRIIDNLELDQLINNHYLFLMSGTKKKKPNRKQRKKATQRSPQKATIGETAEVTTATSEPLRSTPHQYEKIVLTFGIKGSQTWCCSCHREASEGRYLDFSLTPNYWYLCTVCKSGKRVLCHNCYTEPRRDSVHLTGCRGVEGLDDEISEEEELTLLKQLQLNEGDDLAVERIPKYYVPSVQGTSNVFGLSLAPC